MKVGHIVSTAVVLANSTQTLSKEVKPYGYGGSTPSFPVSNPTPAPSRSIDSWPTEPTPVPTQGNSTIIRTQVISDKNDWVMYGLAGSFSALVMVALVVGFKEEIKGYLHLFSNEGVTEKSDSDHQKVATIDIEMNQIPLAHADASAPVISDGSAV